MSAKSKFIERFGHAVETLHIDRVPSGSPVALSLSHTGIVNAPHAARILMKRHLTLKAAHTALTEMVGGEESVVVVPVVEDLAALQDELLAVGVIAKLPN